MRWLLTFLLLTGCEGCRGPRPGAASTEASGEESSAATEAADETEPAATDRRLGTVRGRVRIAEGAAIPSYPPEAVQGGGPAAPPPPECEGTDPEAARRPVVLDDGGLVHVMVTATGDQERFFDALGRWEPRERHVRIEGCRLQPPLVTATRGDTLVLSNESDYPFMVAVGRTSFMEGLLHGSPRRIPLDQGGVQAIRCGFAAPCGRTDVVVVYHPVHTVTGEGGRFELEVPADQDVEIHAWHPLFRDATVTTRVARGQVREIDLVLTPADAGSPEAADDGEAEVGPEAPGGEGERRAPEESDRPF